MNGQAPPDIRVPPPGPRSRDLGSRLEAIESPSVTARREAQTATSGEESAPIVYAEGAGVNVVDADGNRYVDMAAGFGALLLGHRPEVVARAIDRQSRKLWLALGDLCPTEAKVTLCERLIRLYPQAGARVMLGSTGADAVTAALKTATLTTGRAGILAFQGAYHGLSHGPLAACGLRPSYREPFAEALNPHVVFAPYPYDEAMIDETMTCVDRALTGGRVGAVIVEPILGRGGCVVAPATLLPALRAACDRAGALLVCDEIWTGLGRSGAWLASVTAGALPDIVCLGKGLGSGLAISACIGSARVMASWGAHGGTTIHTATHFGSPIQCAAATATLEALEVRDLPARALRVGELWMNRLRQRTEHLATVRDVRGRGLMVGVALEGGGVRGLSVARKLLRKGWIVVAGGPEGDVLTLTPPLEIEERLLDAFSEALAEAVATP
jgi:4-aminobutyrate aminotransferase / (S)-3-amino-2-methylpropionate transaminase / 5-aminovalerate transaminase